MPYTVLICDDDEDILEALAIYLRGEGYSVLKARDGAEAVQCVEKSEVHLVLLDVMMPIMDGIEAAVKIRELSNVPILFLSAKSEDADRILGLNIGGDDYITKPFNPLELFARIKAALRRFAHLGGMTVAASVSAEEGLYQTGGLLLDDRKKQVTLDGEEVTLTAVEYNILRYLMMHLDHVFSSTQIYEAVWCEAAFEVSKIVSVHIRHIREKIELNPKEPRYLKVIYGLGYKVVTVK